MSVVELSAHVSALLEARGPVSFRRQLVSLSQRGLSNAARLVVLPALDRLDDGADWRAVSRSLEPLR